MHAPSTTPGPPRGRRAPGVAAIAALLVAAALTGAVGCSGDRSTSPRAAPGTYALRQVGGQQLPFELFRGPFTDPETGQHVNQLVIAIPSGALTLDAQGRFALVIQMSVTADGQHGNTALQVQGNYEVQGGDVHLTPDDGSLGAKVATLHSGTLSLPLDPLGTGNDK